MADNDKGWQWWGGHDEEVCIYGPCETRQSVIDEATDDGIGAFKAEDGSWKIGVHVLEARKDGLRLADWIGDADEILERADEAVLDSDRASENDDDGFFNCTKEQQADLDRRLKQACNEWQEANNLNFETWSFSASRNHEYVVVDHPNTSGE